MKVTGTATLHATVEEVWATMLDPAVLARAIPGCEALERTGPDRYRGTVRAGVGSIKGVVEGEVELTDLRRPASLVMRASGAGAPGTVKADVRVELAGTGDGRTELRYDADAVVGGMVGGVGQRLLTGVARKMAGEFFARLDRELGGGAPCEAVPDGAAPADAPAPAAAAADRPGRAARRPGGPLSDAVAGAFAGAAIALAGVLVGAALGRRRGYDPSATR
ncbi:carbon monoxide dehydrogenase subunit G [Nocardiopsis mangrovi]|uniref:Carbon monoxide dehydrogenase subunit G n=1 Tax=Nocardiopsis mangrovi TaxID=1179818 RepID=A0ABV9E2W5_9ACTN